MKCIAVAAFALLALAAHGDAFLFPSFNTCCQQPILLPPPPPIASPSLCCQPAYQQLQPIYQPQPVYQQPAYVAPSQQTYIAEPPSAYVQPAAQPSYAQPVAPPASFYQAAPPSYVNGKK